MNSATVSKEVVLSGRGIFSGKVCTARIKPAEPGSGLVLSINDVSIPMISNSYIDSPNCSVMAANGQSVAVTEHLLAALWCAGVDTALITVDGPELPNLDGGAAWQYQAIRDAGITKHGECEEFQPDRTVCFADDNYSFLVYTPGSVLEINYFFAHLELGIQSLSVELDREYIADSILPARTFITDKEVAAAQAAGVLHNEHGEDAIVITDGKPNHALRFEDEFVRHKVLDLLGDLAVVPFELTGRITACRSGHSLNRRLAGWLTSEFDGRV